MKKSKKKRYFYFALSLLYTSAVATLIACAPTQTKGSSLIDTSFKTYDLGLATEPINTLNYIKYKSLDKIIPSLVTPYISAGPDGELKSIIRSKNYKMVLLSTNLSDQQLTSNFNNFFTIKKTKLQTSNGEVSNNFYNLNNFSMIGGLSRASDGGELGEESTILIFPNPKNANTYMAATGRVNINKNYWSNGDVITAQDLRDYLEYIYDLSTTSQHFDKLLKWGIRGVDEFINAQKEYIRKFNRAYSNPWGRRNYIIAPWSKENSPIYIQNPEQSIWDSQTKDENGGALDTLEVAKIKETALNMGFYTGQLFLDYTNDEIAAELKNPKNISFNINADKQDFYITKENKEYKITLLKNPYRNPYQVFDKKTLKSKIISTARDRNEFTIIFDENKNPSMSFLTNILTTLYPANRKYIETKAGGIDKYGSDTSLFLTTGPFKIKDPKNNILLGPQGYINIVKNEDYFEAENTIPNTIKIYFSNNPQTNRTMFEDNLIAQAFISSTNILQYWTDAKYKSFLKKNTGFGTIAFAFNLDRQSNGHNYLQDANLRKAIYYLIDREAVLKTVGWDFSFPVTTFTASGQYKENNGKEIDFYFDNEQTVTENGIILPLQNYPYILKTAKIFNFENTNRKDTINNLEAAKYYLDLFKKAHPHLKQVHLTFLHNTSNEQREAGGYLQAALNQTEGFKDFVILESKGVPENIFVSFVEQGNYDIIYQNFDRIGGNLASDYIQTFFLPDELDLIDLKTIAFKQNPAGSFTYADYFSQISLKQINNLVATGQAVNFVNILKPYFDVTQLAIEQIPDFNAEFNSMLNESQIGLLGKKSKILAQRLALHLKLKYGNDKKYFVEVFNESFLENILQNLALVALSKATNNVDIQRKYSNLAQSRINKLQNFITYIYFNNSKSNLSLGTEWYDIMQNKKEVINFADKIALNSFEFAKKHKFTFDPFPEINEAKKYAFKVLDLLSKLSEGDKKNFIKRINEAKDVHWYEKSLVDKSQTIYTIIEEATAKNNDAVTALKIQVDIKMRQLMLYRKAIELSYFKNNENLIDYNSRLNSFFSGNFSLHEALMGWTQSKVFQLIALFEKIIRDTAPVIPLMEVDTNWELTRIGGIKSIYTYHLQYAYDYTNPPRPGLPRKRAT
ncbi:ABC transporter substrate-binding protein [Candidatus Mycoplasma pogonae]